MKIACTKEIKVQEYRVGMTPDNVKAYVSAGHEVYIEKNAGIGSGFTNEEYLQPVPQYLKRQKKPGISLT